MLANVSFEYATVRGGGTYLNGANLVWIGAHSNSESIYKANTSYFIHGWPAAVQVLENE